VAAALAVVPLVGLAALIVGEYEISPVLGGMAGLLVGLAAGELAVTVARSHHPGLAVVTALLAGAALVWAGRIDAGHGIEPVKPGAWLGAALAAGVAGARVTGLRQRSGSDDELGDDLT
jgi:hypothetical protein